MSLTPQQTSRVIGEIQTDGVVFSEVVHSPQYWMSAHRHPQAHLILVLKGAVEHLAGRDRYMISERSAALVPAGEKHSDLFLGHVRTFQIMCEETQLSQIGETCTGQAFHREHPTTMLLKSAYREFKNPDHYTPMVLEALTVELLVGLQRQRKPLTCHKGRPKWLDRARELLHDQCSESLTLDEIAHIVGVHPAHLTRAFRRGFGQSIGEYVRELRIARARHLLETSEMTIGEIAHATGFADHSHFARTFKKYTGRSPQSYREEHRNAWYVL